MKVVINHKEVELAADVDNVAELLKSQGISENGHAVAVNNRVVPRTAWGEFRLEEGMKITVIKAVCGG